MKWKQPPISKIYEALGTVADGRVKLEGDAAKVYSSSGNKFYTVTYDAASESIMVNDNASFYQGYLGYPAIAFLMAIGEIKYASDIARELKGIAWKDLNQKNKNDFEKTVQEILDQKMSDVRHSIETEVRQIDKQLQAKRYSLLGPKVKPPEGY